MRKLTAAMTPAQLCYQNTAKDGNGFLTAFDANVCYAVSGSVPAPAPTMFGSGYFTRKRDYFL
jgi:hypothetical protein